MDIVSFVLEPTAQVDIKCYRSIKYQAFSKSTNCINTRNMPCPLSSKAMSLWRKEEICRDLILDCIKLPLPFGKLIIRHLKKLQFQNVSHWKVIKIESTAGRIQRPITYNWLNCLTTCKLQFARSFQTLMWLFYLSNDQRSYM